MDFKYKFQGKGVEKAQRRKVNRRKEYGLHKPPTNRTASQCCLLLLAGH